MKFDRTLLSAGAHPFLFYALRFFRAAILAGSQIFGGYAPFALGFVAAAGSGMEGLCALLGLLTGALLLMPFTAAMKYIAIAILIFSVSMAFFDTKLYQKNAFLPMVTAACTAAVGFVYLSGPGLFSLSGAYYLLEILLAALCTCAYRVALRAEDFPLSRRQMLSFFVLLITMLIAVASIPLVGSLSLGRIFAVVLVLTAGRLGGAGAGCMAG